MIIVTLYYRDQCPACEQVEVDLQELQQLIPHQLVKLNIGEHPDLYQVFSESIPVVEVGPYVLRNPVTRRDLQVALGAAQDRQDHLGKTDEQYQQRLARGQTLTSSDRFAYFFSKTYIWFINFFLMLYVGLPFLAPVLMKYGYVSPARVIYTIYSPLCHQLAFRSWFLFGKQAFYPRQLAHIPNTITYEDLTNESRINLINAREFIGNEQVGYKVAICERDVAIYGSLLIFGILYGVTQRRIKAIPWYVWAALGLLPIGIDGLSQLPGITQLQWLPSWIPLRESTPFYRTFTGGLFGFLTAWYIFPLIEESMRDTRRVLVRKMAAVALHDSVSVSRLEPHA